MKKQILTIILIVLILTQNLSLTVCAATLIDNANLINDHSINTHIQFNKNDTWVDVVCNYICYISGGKKYPAYCVSHGLHGVDEEGSYTVSISETLKDERIWRTIVNGYPYVSLEKLGVDTADEAYLITKQAIFSILTNRDVKNFYKPKDEKGVKIIEEIYKLAEIGKNGTQKYKTANISLNKESEFIKLNENEYYIEYSILANTSIQSFKVELENTENGVYITDTLNNKRENFNKNEKFRLVINKDKLDKDITKNLIINSKCETYPIYLGNSPKENLQNYAITSEIIEDFENEFNINIKTNLSKIKVIKQDEETGKAIPGVKFEIKKDDILLDTKVTDEERYCRI